MFPNGLPAQPEQSGWYPLPGAVFSDCRVGESPASLPTCPASLLPPVPPLPSGKLGIPLGEKTRQSGPQMLFPLLATQAHPHLGGPWPVFRTIGGSPPIPAHSPPMDGAPMGAPWVLPGQWCHLPNACPGCSLEGLMLKLKLQYFGQLVRRADSFEKTLMMGKIEGRRRRG